MKKIILETLIDSLKLIPFLFIAFLIIELFEHKLSKKSLKLVEKSGKFGPFIAPFLGAFPQCGFSVLATNLYVTRIISLGTLIGIYLSTSDEMLPILISKNANLSIIVTIITIKIIIGIICGFIIDFIFLKYKKTKIDYHICKDSQCHCEHGIIFSALKHTIYILSFIMIFNFTLNICFEYLGKEYIEKIFLNGSVLAPFISSLIGLIPNCGASIMITELYLNNVLSFGSMLSGLLTGSGIAILVLFKENKNIKENISILLLVYFIGALSGVIINLIN